MMWTWWGTPGSLFVKCFRYLKTCNWEQKDLNILIILHELSLKKSWNWLVSFYLILLDIFLGCSTCYAIFLGGLMTRSQHFIFSSLSSVITCKEIHLNLSLYIFKHVVFSISNTSWNSFLISIYEYKYIYIYIYIRMHTCMCVFDQCLLALNWTDVVG